MAFDIYSPGQDASDQGVDGTRVLVFCIIRVEADADSSMLVRIASTVNFANAAPWSVVLTTRGEIVEIVVEFRSLRAGLAEFMRRKLLQLTCVRSVELETSKTESSDARSAAR